MIKLFILLLTIMSFHTTQKNDPDEGLQSGQEAPHFTAKDQHGKVLNLTDQLNEQAVVLVFGKDGTDLELGLMLIGQNLRKSLKKRILLPLKSICQRIKKSAITPQDAVRIENQKTMGFISSYNQTH